MSTLPPLPEWSLRDDLGELVPSEIRVALRAYATAAISEQAAEVEALRDELRLCCELKREYQEQVASKVDEVEALRAKVAEWEKLRDPVTLHVSLLRGFPARLSRAVFLHLAGDEEPKF